MDKIRRLLRYDLPVHFALLLTNWLPDSTWALRLRGLLVTPFLGSCGGNLRLGRNVSFYNPSQVHMGRDVYVAYGCWFSAAAEIRVGDEVLFGPYCVAASGNHTRVGRSFRYGAPERRPIRIGSGCWIASHVILTAGCEVGEGSLVAAGAVVSQPIPADVVAAGQPARPVRALVP